MLSRESSATLMSAVTAFVYKEARLQDEHAYEAWESLWTDDGVYWVPANGADIDPERKCRSSTTTARGFPCVSSNC